MIVLLYPPFADPTQGYPALPLIKGYLKENGIESEIVDLNLRAILETAASGERSFILGFQNEKAFFNVEEYEKSVQGLNRYYKRLSRSSGFLIDNNRHFDPNGPWNLKKLRAYFKYRRSPFHRYYEETFRRFEINPPLLFGINLTFASQIPETFYLAQRLKECFPKSFVFLGGALAGQIVSQVSRKKIEQLLGFVDGICYFEGGPALRFAAAQLESAGKIVEPIPNSWVKVEGRAVKGSLSILDFEKAPLPDFDGFALDDYLAPSPIILFHPSAGCYWNRCSFCRYGFNQECGTKYREMNAAYAVSQARTLRDRYGVENFYMSSDVLSPKFAIRFAREAAEQQLQIKWSTDLRVETAYSESAASTLAAGGLVSAALGIESGSDRLLKKMNKGIRCETISAVSRALGEAGIAVSWMMFHYHPSETYDEALKTVRFLQTHRKEVSLFIIGEFGLTPHSEIFNDPARFGIRKIRFHAEDEFRLYPYPEYAAMNPHASTAFAETLDRSVEETAAGYCLRPYPYAGAVSTHHSMLYFIHFGPDAFKRAGRG